MNLLSYPRLDGHLVEILRSETSVVNVGDIGKVLGFARVDGVKVPGYEVQIFSRLHHEMHQARTMFFTRNELKDLGTRS